MFLVSISPQLRQHNGLQLLFCICETSYNKCFVRVPVEKRGKAEFSCLDQKRNKMTLSQALKPTAQSSARGVGGGGGEGGELGRIVAGGRRGDEVGSDNSKRVGDGI